MKPDRWKYIAAPVCTSICYFFGGLKCVGHSFAYVAHFVFLRDAWIRTQRAAVAARRATNLATHFPNLETNLPILTINLPP
jgi:hypothetical protein